jgi:hypothetical protein
VSTNKKKAPAAKGWYWTLSLHKSTQPDKVVTRDLTPAQMNDLADELSDLAGDRDDTSVLGDITGMFGEIGAIEPTTETLEITLRVPIKGVADSDRLAAFKRALEAGGIDNARIDNSYRDDYRW